MSFSDPRSAADVAVRAATFLYRQPAGAGLKTILAAETAVEQDVTLGYVVVNRSGVIAASGADSAARGRYVTTLELPEGNYMLKVAVIDAAGRRGSVERHFDVRLSAAGGVSHGDLLLAEPPAPGVESMQPVVRALRSRELLAYVELYGPPGWVPRQDDVRAELIAREGDTTALLTPTISQSADGRWVISARANLHEAEPGPRLVIVTIAVPGAAPLRLARTFDIDPK